MKKFTFRNPSFVISVLGLTAVTCVYLLWLISPGTHANKAGYAASFLSVVLFTVLCLRFVPVWMDFWKVGSRTSEIRSGEHPYTAVILFFVFLGVNLAVQAAVHLFRILAGDTTTFIDGLEMWLWLDTGFYLDIAENWYTAVGTVRECAHIVFFPAFPLAIKAVSLVVSNSLHAALLVSAFCYSLSAGILYKLLCLDHSHRDALRGVKYFALFPAAFFFCAPLSESFFFLFSVLCIYLCRKEKWLIGCLCGAVAAFSKALGVFVFAAVILEGVHMCIGETGSRRKWILRFSETLIIPMGTVAYLLINYFVFGDCFKFMEYESSFWEQNMVPFFSAIAMQIDNGLAMVFTPDYRTAIGCWLPNQAFIFSILLVFLFAAKDMRPSYTAWFIAYFVFSIGASFLISAPRYLTSAVSLYPALVHVTKNRKLDVLFTVICILGYVYYLWAFCMHWEVY